MSRFVCPFLPRVGRRALVVLACGLSLGLLTLQGCGSSQETAKKVEPEVKVEPKQPKEEPKPEPPDPAKVWAGLVEQANKQLAADKLDEMANSLTELEKELAKREAAPEEQRQLADLQTKMVDRRKELADKIREADIADAQKMMDVGKLDDASKKLASALSLDPTEKQRDLAQKLQKEIDRRLAARGRLVSAIKLLESKSRSDVRAGQNQLHEEPETSIPLLLDVLKSPDKPLLVSNAMETLRRIKRPDVSVPAIAAILTRTEQKKNWADAIRELGLIESAGAGSDLLKLATSTNDAEQREAALTALSQAPDPPVNTLVALLPIIDQDGPALASALQAATHSVRLHHQQDLAARRGLPDNLSSEQSEQLAALPARLAQLTASPSKDVKSPGYAAQVFAMTTRQIAPSPLMGVKVLRATGQAEDAPPEALLDGVWNSIDPKTMWRMPLTPQANVIFDLGEERTVVGVRIWNFNEPNGIHRGFKEADVFVSEGPTLLSPVATGIVPQAPGAADTPDYSTVIPIPCIRGRYVKIQAKSLWRDDTYLGLSEVQILGF